MKIDLSSGIYILEIFSPFIFKVLHKKYCSIEMQMGYYYYFGSAMKNLKSRIARHKTINKKLHWHIDYITSNPDNTISNVYIIPSSKKTDECQARKNFQTEFNLTHPLKNFGSSDCTVCESHLLYSRAKINQSQLFSLYQSTVLLIPSSSDIS